MKSIEMAFGLCGLTLVVAFAAVASAADGHVRWRFRQCPAAGDGAAEPLFLRPRGGRSLLSRHARRAGPRRPGRPARRAARPARAGMAMHDVAARRPACRPCRPPAEGRALWRGGPVHPRPGSGGISISLRPKWRAAAGFCRRSPSLSIPQPPPPRIWPPPRGPSWAGGGNTAT